jgi:hypothetical protein
MDRARFNLKQPGSMPPASRWRLAKGVHSQCSSACGAIGTGRG